jgi:hypothetical protein
MDFLSEFEKELNDELAQIVKDEGQVGPDPGPIDLFKKFEEQMNESIEKMNNIDDTPKIKILGNQSGKSAKMVKIKVPSVHSSFNILDEETKRSFTEEIYNDEDGVISIPKVAMVNMGGALSGVEFKEEYLINFIEPTDKVFMAECNFGYVVHPDWAQIGQQLIEEKVIKHAKRQKKRPKRAQLGHGTMTGLCHNSQITFIVYVDGEYIKYKIFRNGSIQLPGSGIKSIEKIIESVNLIIDILTKALIKAGMPPKEEIRLIKLCPINKNYKLYYKIPEGSIVDLKYLGQIFEYIKFIDKLHVLDEHDELTLAKTQLRKDHNVACKIPACQVCHENRLIEALRGHFPMTSKITQEEGLIEMPTFSIPAHPPIESVVKSDNIKLTIEFATPIHGKENKIIKVNVFSGSKVGYNDDVWGAKINILGAYGRESSKAICDLLVFIYEATEARLVIDVKKRSTPKAQGQLEDNIGAQFGLPEASIGLYKALLEP